MYFLYVRNGSKDQWQMMTGRGFTTFEQALDMAQSQAQYWTYMVIVNNGKDIWNK